MGKVQEIHYFDGIEKESLFLFIALGLALGFSSGYMSVSINALMPGIVSILICIMSIRKGKKYFFAFFLSFALFFILGLLHTAISSAKGLQTVTGVVIRVKNNYFILWNGWHKYYIYEKDCVREFGDIIKVNGYISHYEQTEYESKFSFVSYLESIGVKNSINLVSNESIVKMPIRLREKELKFLSNFNSETSSLIDSLLFGRKDYSNSIINSAACIGCLNFLSSSGMIYGGVLRFSDKVLSYKLDDDRKRVVSFIFGLFLIPFFIGKVGAYRVLLIRFFDIYAMIRKRNKPSYISKLSWSAIAMLLISPYQSMTSGFLLGYGISLYMSINKDHLLFPKNYQKKIMSFLSLTVFLLPLFNIRGELKLLAPFFSFIFMPISYSFSAISFISFLSVPNVSLLEGYAKFILMFLDFLEKIELSVPLGDFSSLVVFIYYLSIFCSIYFEDLGLTNVKKYFQFLGVLSLTIPSLPLTTAISQEVSFINVGQGDAIILRDGFTNVMIDTGGSLSFDMAKEVDIPYFRKEKIYKLDCLILSHSDYDHSGAKDSLISNFSVKRVVESTTEFPLKIGNFTFYNYNTYGGDSTNEQSLVISTFFMGKTFLFTGDADKNIEKKIIADNPSLDVDILKVGHHGSKTSTSFEFLQAITPSVAIISVGKNNKYGHPSEDVLKRLEQQKIKIRRTDLEGTITYKTYFHAALGDL